jgi:very-short-patch-repair endonuclease
MLASMGHKPMLPPALLRGAFTLDDARRAGLTRWQLEGTSWTRLGPATYVSAALRGEPMHRLAAAMRRLPSGAAFSGLTAAWLHGIDVNPCNPIEATVPENAGVSARSGIAVRRSSLDRTDVVRVRGLRATSIVRTLGEVCGRLGLVEAVVIADAAVHDRRVRLAQLVSWADAHGGRRGIQNLRRVLQHVDGSAESPMETRLRMLLVLGGLPRPRAQVEIHDRWGRFVGRLDLYYEHHRLGIEYDGGTHRDSLADDNRRQNKLLNAGVRLLRFTAGDVFGNPDSVLSQVEAALASPSAKPATAGARALQPLRKGATAGARG